jgi:hypothetical protein
MSNIVGSCSIPNTSGAGLMSQNRTSGSPSRSRKDGRFEPRHSRQSVNICRATIARMPPAVKVAPAINSVARCALIAASVCEAACRS